MIKKLCFTALAAMALAGSAIDASAQKIAKYNLVYDTPTKDSWGSMVCGNGDISSNVWIDTAGDLHFYIGKTDSHDYLRRLLKITEVKVRFSPAIFKDVTYRQEFDLQTASWTVKTSKGDLRFWVDANNPQVIVQVNSAQSVSAHVTANVWRRKEKVYREKTFPVTFYEEPDSLVQNRKNDIVLFHRNQRTDLFDGSMKVFKLNKDSVHDPFKDLTFGVQLYGKNFTAETDSSMVTASSARRLELRVTAYTAQTNTSADWVRQIEDMSKKASQASGQQLFKKHAEWWKQFWHQSHIEISSSNPAYADTIFSLNQAYYYNRYVMNIAARGKYPIQFNGSTWLVDTFADTIYSSVGGKIHGRNADYRLWGELILWQNMRLPYWTMPASGDFDAMHSLLDFYTDRVYPLMKDFTQNVLGKQGCLFTEGVEHWGTLNTDIYGWKREGKRPDEFLNVFHQDHYICGLELVNLLLDYYAYTANDDYLKKKVWPIAKDLVTYYSTRYPLDERGKLKIFPARSLESFSDCTNPTPDVAGLHFILPRLQKLAVQLKDKEFEKQCKDFIGVLPAVPVRKEVGGDVILAAEITGKHINVEQPDLYPVYPFRLFTITTPKLKTGQYTFEHPSFDNTTQKSYGPMPFVKIKGGRAIRDIFSWHQTGVQAAYLGLTDYAREIAVRSAQANDKRFRFPSFYGPNYDYTPDGDHLAIINMTLQSMILQSENGSIYVLPAWPKEWDVDFKLHAFQNTVVEGTYKGGKFEKLETSPGSRKKNIITAL